MGNAFETYGIKDCTLLGWNSCIFVTSLVTMFIRKKDQMNLCFVMQYLVLFLCLQMAALVALL